MASKHVCSNPECNSKRFVTPSRVVEYWLVDEVGNYIETVETTETSHGPDDDNCWTCAECGADAVVATDETEKLPPNMRVYEGELGCSFELWSNNAGDLFNSERDLAEDELPAELKRAYDELYCEGSWEDTCLCMLDGKPGIALLTHYSAEMANKMQLTYGELLEKARSCAAWYARKFRAAEVVFGKNSLEWHAPMIGKEHRESVLILWLPWDTPHEQFARIEGAFTDTCLNFEVIPDAA